MSDAAAAETNGSPTGAPQARPPAPSFVQALRFWARLGCISFGGPAGQSATMHRERVARRRGISARRFLHALNYCMLLPGPEAQQLATYLGWLLHRTWGGVVAGALFVLPSLVLLIGLSAVYMALGQHPVVAGVFYGIKPAVTAIVLQAAWRIGSRTLRNGWMWAIAAASFLALFVGQLPFPAIVLGAAAIGALGGRWWPEVFAVGGAHAAARAGYGPAVLDDDDAPPAHARPSVRRLAGVVLAGLALWLLPMAALWAWGGSGGTLTQMGWFFTKAALLTFGGAYAVLPYVHQGAVLQHGWLSAPQMMDGLALGETTPGPLIMVVAFVAFVGGWGAGDIAAALGPGNAWLAGALAAIVVTWFTFLPSFIFILAGAPVIEHSHGQRRLTAPLSAITAAVVGVIVNLALFFGAHVLWPQGRGGAFDAVAAVLAAAAALALLRFKRGVIETLIACAAVGLVLHLAR
ncbi:MAG: chromate efflux transporter [Aquabacterium sp.]